MQRVTGLPVAELRTGYANAYVFPMRNRIHPQKGKMEMKQQEPNKQEQVHTGKQVLFRLIAFVLGITVLILLVKMLLE